MHKFVPGSAYKDKHEKWFKYPNLELWACIWQVDRTGSDDSGHLKNAIITQAAPLYFIRLFIYGF